MMLLLTGSSLTFAQIQFEEFDWEELTRKAANEDKLIMVDMTATWCGWCKFMDKNIFSKKKVGDYYNANFISTKLYDTHPMGSKFNSKYKVDGFPTMLFLDSKGKLVYTIGGAIQDVNAFISEGKSAKRKGAYVYNGGGNDDIDEIDPTLLEESFAIEEMANDGDLEYEQAYLNFLKKKQILNTEVEMDLTRELTLMGSRKAVEQVNQRLDKFEEKYTKDDILKIRLGGAIIVADDQVQEKLDPDQLNIQDQLEEIVFPIFKEFIKDEKISKASAYLGIGAILMNYELMEESVYNLIQFEPMATSLLTEDGGATEFYKFLTMSIAEDEMSQYYKKAIVYGEKAVALGAEKDIYPALYFLYEELGDQKNAQKYLNLMEE